MSTELFWRGVTRLGESGIVVPVVLLASVGVGWAARRVMPALAFLLPVTIAAVVVTASKVAFLGFGWGIAAIDFTGLSGHAMFAAAIYPLLAATFAPAASSRQAWAMAAASLVVLVVAVSRVAVGAHSVSETIGGAALGVLAAGVGIRMLHRVSVPKLAFAWLVPALAWLLLTLPAPPVIASHGWVTKLATALSGRDRPYVRADLHRR